MGQKENHALNTALLMIVSGLVGATVALLFAPQSGKQTRRDIRKFGNKVVNRAEEFQTDLRERIDDFVEEVVDATSSGFEKTKEATTRVREEVVGALQAGKDMISEQIDRVEVLFRR